MKTRTAVLKAVIAGAVLLTSVQVQADILEQAVRLGAYEVEAGYIPLTNSGALASTFSGSGRFSIWYTAECTASEYVNVDLYVDSTIIRPTGGNIADSFCDFNTRGAMHTVTGRTESLPAGTHTVRLWVSKSGSGHVYLSDSSLLIGK